MSRAADTAIIMLAVLAFAGAFTWLGPVLKPFLVAVFLFYVAQLGAKTLARLGLGPRMAYTGLLGITVILTVLFGQLVSREATLFLGKWPKYEARITKVINSLPQFDQLLRGTGTKAPAPLQPGEPPPPVPAPPEPAPADTSLGDLFRSFSKATVDYVLHHTLGSAEVFLLVLVYLIFLFIGSEKLPDRIQGAFPGEQGRRILLIGEGISHSMERFMTVKTIVGVGMGATAGLIMFFFGLDHWLLWAFLFFASNYITYIGSIVACVPPIVMAFLGLATPTAAIVLSVLLVVNRLLWIDFVEIRMSGKELNLDPTLMFLWLSYWGWAWGVLGLLLAYPMLAAVKIVLTHVKGGEGWAVLLSEDAPVA
ncbi:MAG: transport protein TqsA [Planctomycetota bacterium]|jgi:AI-2 transport protein TqsA